MNPNHVEREYTAFLDKVRDRARKSPQLFAARNRWVEPIAVTRVKKYDQETDAAIADIRKSERKAS